MALAYSYIRFSSEKQKLGDSLRRQLERAESYATKHGLTLDHTSYRDLGISAFKGKNAEDGKLAVFLNAVKKRLIPPGSTLLIEDFDRLSRNEIDDALILFLQIIRSGITVVTLKDEQVYTQDRIRNDSSSLIVSIMYMGRAHDESAMKSDRVKRAWDKKRESGKIITAMAPAWLALSEDRTKWKQDKNKVQVVRTIFKLALDGNGTPTIARMLNEASTPTMKKAAHWTFGTVNAILKNRAVIGTYTPKKSIADPINNYYPAIVPVEQFQLAQESMTKRKWIGGRSRENVANLFSGISYCHKCGGKMRIVGSGGRHIYLKCLTAYSKSGCNEGRFPYLAAERAVLRHMADELSELVTKAEDDDSVDQTIVLKDSRNEIARRLDNLVENLADTGSSAVAAKIRELQRQVEELDTRIETEVQPHVRKQSLVEAAEIFETLKWSAGSEIPLETRLQLQSLLRRILQTVFFFCDAENKRPTVAIQYVEALGGRSHFFDVRPFMEKVGGNRRILTKLKPE